jgi:hypothetical protein
MKTPTGMVMAAGAAFAAALIGLAPTTLADKLDPSAFSDAPDLGGLPDNAIGDFAVGLDYGLYANGLGSLDFGLGVLLGVFSIYPI